MDANPIYILFGAFALFTVLFWVHVIQQGRKRDAAAFQREQVSVHSVPRLDARAAKRDLTRLQKLFAIPLLGSWLGTGFGLFLPVLLFASWAPAAIIGSSFEIAAVAAIVLVWNLTFTRLTKVNITTPVVPIPLSLVSFIFCLIGLWIGYTE